MDENMKQEVQNMIDEAFSKAMFDSMQEYATGRDLFKWAQKTDYVSQAKSLKISDGTNPMKLCTRVEVWAYIIKLYHILKGGI